MGVWGVNTPPGPLNENEKGPFKMMGTPTLRQFKMMRSPLPDRRNLSDACSLYVRVLG